MPYTRFVTIESHMKQNRIKSTPKPCRNSPLRPNELQHAFLAMRIIYCREAEDPETNHYSQKLKRSD